MRPTLHAEVSTTETMSPRDYCTRVQPGYGVMNRPAFTDPGFVFTHYRPLRLKGGVVVVSHIRLFYKII